MADQELLCFNGINGATGNYLLPPMSADAIAAIAMGKPLDPRLKKELAFWAERATTKTFGVAAWIDAGTLRTGIGRRINFRWHFDLPQCVATATTFQKIPASQGTFIASFRKG